MAVIHSNLPHIHTPRSVSSVKHFIFFEVYIDLLLCFVYIGFVGDNINGSDNVGPTIINVGTSSFSTNSDDGVILFFIIVNSDVTSGEAIAIRSEVEERDSYADSE